MIKAARVGPKLSVQMTYLDWSGAALQLSTEALKMVDGLQHSNLEKVLNDADATLTSADEASFH